MWRSLLLGKLAISIAVSLLVGGFGFWRVGQPEISSSEYYSWLAVGVFFVLLALIQIALGLMLFRKKKIK